jgi:predicted RNA-binding protein (virulence factor B family)
MSKYTPGQKVELVILRETPLGFVAQINGVDEGLLYHNEVFELLERGEKLPGYIKQVRENGNIDLLLQPLGHAGAADLGECILDALEQSQGFLPLTSKTEAEEIYRLFGVSKKKYKMAIGGLYKKRLIKIEDDGIYLVKNA